MIYANLLCRNSHFAFKPAEFWFIIEVVSESLEFLMDGRLGLPPFAYKVRNQKRDGQKRDNGTSNTHHDKHGLTGRLRRSEVWVDESLVVII